MEDYSTPPPVKRGAEDRPAGWEQAVIARVAEGWLVEQRRARRWKIFFRFTGLAVVLLALLTIGGRMSGLSSPEAVAARHTALIELTGVIDATGEASADHIVSALQSAFKDSKTAGIVLRINSPGGSPVQAGVIYDEILRLRAKHPETPLYAVVEEMCASGGYYVAAAADRIYVDKASLVGSIGVLMDGFGFVAAMEKLGVERRLLTAGANKGFLDSFSPLSDDQKKFAQSMLAEIHQQFIDAVRKGRGDRLKETPDVFSGLFWTGARSVELGLADGFGTAESVARDVIKAEDLVDFSPRENIAERLAKRIGASAGQALLRSLESGGAGVRVR